MTESPQSLSDKLRAIGHRDVEGVQMTSEESHERAQQMAYLSMPTPSNRFRSAQADYLRTAYRPTLLQRAGAWLAALWNKCWGGILCIVATSFFALGLCL